MLSATDLRLTFNPGTPIRTQALRGMSLDIPTGQFVTVIGSNGAGKSTFPQRAISGDQRWTAARSRSTASDVTRQPVWGACRARGARVPGPDGRHLRRPHHRGEHGAGQMRGERRGLRRAVKPALREVPRTPGHLGLGLENRLTDRIGLLSGGQRQAVSLLMAALQPSRILLLDEHRRARPRTADFRSGTHRAHRRRQQAHHR